MWNNNEKTTSDVEMSTNNMSRIVWIHSEFFFCFFNFVLLITYVFFLVQVLYEISTKKWPAMQKQA